MTTVYTFLNIISLILLLTTIEGKSALEVLGFEYTSDPTKEEIKDRFKQLSMKYHPDRNPDPASHKKYEQIINAYQTLKAQNFQPDSYFPHDDLHMEDFMHGDQFTFTFTSSSFEQPETIEIQLNLFNFIKWCWYNPELLIGVLLVSIGLVNLCWWCCKCCWWCCCC